MKLNFNIQDKGIHMMIYMCDVYTFHTMVVAKILNFSHRVSASPRKKGGDHGPRVPGLTFSGLGASPPPPNHSIMEDLPTCWLKKVGTSISEIVCAKLLMSLLLMFLPVLLS
jgi:hypothetical protein